MNSKADFPGTKSIAGSISTDAARLSEALNHHMRNSFQPESRKTLRKFHPAEVSELTGISMSNLRTRHQEGDFPDVETDSRGRRLYTAEEIDQIRKVMAKTGRNGDAYLPGRRDGDALQILSIVNFKGGSSKTTTAIHLAQRYALRGYRVLAVDMDPQASLTTMFGYRPEIEFAESGTIYDALKYEDPVPLSQVVRKTYFHNLDLAPAGLLLSEYETETAYALQHKVDPPFTQRLAIALDEIEANYDLVIIDCPPQLGFTTMTALLASTGLLITVVPSMLDVASMAQFLEMAGETVRTLEEATGPIDWSFLKYLVARFEPTDVPQSQMAGFLRSILLDQVLATPMLKSTAISDAGMTQQTIYELEPSQVVKKTLDRIMESVNGVADEFEKTIQQSWGRTVD
ncbi:MULTISPECIES: plasmid partitioning protein RepA [Marinovum]|jgi:chromosome partitioning protein|uniref:Chromosome partitioning protein n=1 Tax=Marinovum algicola TaxID=42444 RepID=A0A975WES6_9RHOB|nr:MULTISPECIES: plasmid partitioning protein RepA [Marinovum]AKO99021.1 plasmid partitioning protein ParA [Marinovum algicola DG 898]MDD9741647.1 plasmid partitioning protein RepA [Marinovum sp. SP66]MDD9746682.1 plasmid partitioning protein RepA [Marinovum sp. PR37]SEK08730.1 chromosome partitioning protein [Marinovum algicola]SLN77517.1 Sporulation initiation inhibitor protein Soj [Marinovum algicola]